MRQETLDKIIAWTYGIVCFLIIVGALYLTINKLGEATVNCYNCTLLS